jgi:hypothetical protein
LQLAAGGICRDGLQGEDSSSRYDVHT